MFSIICYPHCAVSKNKNQVSFDFLRNGRMRTVDCHVCSESEQEGLGILLDRGYRAKLYTFAVSNLTGEVSRLNNSHQRF